MPQDDPSNGTRRTTRTTRAATGAGLGAVLAVAAFASMRGGLFTRGAVAELARPAVAPGAMEDGVIDVPAEARSLQAALDAAPDGATVRLAAGRHVDAAACGGKSVTLVGAGPGETVLRGVGRGAALSFSGTHANRVELRGLTVEGGIGDGAGLGFEGVSFEVRDVRVSSNRGGGAVVSGASGDFVGCGFEGNRSPGSGGAVRNDGGTVRFVECRFEGNVASAFGGAVASERGRVELIACTLTSNATHSGAWGGAVYGHGAQVELLGSDFEGNRAIDSGGAVFLSGGTADVSRCSFSGNAAAEARSIFSRGAGVRVAATRLCGAEDLAVGGDLVLGEGNVFDTACMGDCNQNGMADSEEIGLGWADDRDGNGVPDSCDPDCNMNGLPDAYEIGAGLAQDANANGLVDLCEIRAGLALDVDNDWVPDDAQSRQADGGLSGSGGPGSAPQPPDPGVHGGEPVFVPAAPSSFDPWPHAAGPGFPH